MSTRSIKIAVQYTCPMQPEIIRNNPGACPICGMELVPTNAEAEDEDTTYKQLRLGADLFIKINS